MGVVYRAWDPDIERDVAIKTIKRSLDLPSPKRAEYLERFKREARAAGKLSDNPHIVPVFDVGSEGDLPYIVMAYVEGESLDKARRRGLDEVALETLARDICSALGHAHKQGTIHRDVKPANILMTKRGAMLTDFGIARLDGSELTRAGTFLGSPSYMSPEQVKGGDIAGTSDLFSMAVILYLLLTGTKPFPGEDTNEILYKIVHTAHEGPSKHDAKLAKWDAFFERALAKEAAKRWPDAEQFFKAFEGVIAGREAAAERTATKSTLATAPAAQPGDAPAPRKLAASKPERQSPLADRSIVDWKDRIPSRRGVGTDTGRLSRLLKPGRRRGRGIPRLVWLAGGLLAIVAALTGTYYVFKPAKAGSVQSQPRPADAKFRTR
jgi:serine/threonine-protein kinase